MRRHSKPDPSNFCKLLTDEDCTSIMQIPSWLVKSYREVLPKEATLRIGESGKCWRVGIEKFKDQYFFTDGWKKFAEDVDLESWESLLFKSAAFQQDKTSSARDFTKENENEDSFTDHEEGSDVGEKLTFLQELKIHHAYRLDIPKYFAKGTGITTTTEMQLLDGERRKWPIHITKRGVRLSLGSGFKDFLIGNKVVVGSTISFEFVSRNTIKARVVKEGLNKTELFNFVKREGGGNKYVLVYSHKTSDDHAKRASNSHMNVESEYEDNLTERENDSRVSRKWVFSKELKKNHAYTLHIPSDFARGTGITRRNQEIKLQDGKGRKWPVQVKCRKYGIYEMSGGWNDFLRGNKVGVGSKISFKWIPGSGNLIEAKVISNGTEGKSLFCKRGRGRPPKRPPKL